MHRLYFKKILQSTRVKRMLDEKIFLQKQKTNMKTLKMQTFGLFIRDINYVLLNTLLKT